jgi:hypothetical protein
VGRSGSAFHLAAKKGLSRGIRGTHAQLSLERWRHSVWNKVWCPRIPAIGVTVGQEKNEKRGTLS